MSTDYIVDDEEPFFTAGHVFFTTSGPKAVDPELAMMENPWANVGRLSVGHILYRLAEDGRDYEQVLVESITGRQIPEVTSVYGVHLREGRRSYHANRYLVAVNYPEVTLLYLRIQLLLRVLMILSDHYQEHLQSPRSISSGTADEHASCC